MAHTPIDPLVDELMCRLDEVDRLDRESRRRVPARLATLVRRTVRSLPSRLRTAIEEAGAAAPVERTRTVEHAFTLVRTLEIVESLTLHRPLADWIVRLHDAARDLVTAARGRETAEAPQHLVIALFDEALPSLLTSTTPDGWFDGSAAGVELARRWVALAEEGWATADECSAAAAFALSCAMATTHVAESYRYAERAAAWWPGREPRCCVTARLAVAARAAGRDDGAIEAAERLLWRLDRAERGTCECVLGAGRVLADALARRGEHERAIEVAGLTAWAAERMLGTGALEAVAAYSTLARVVGRVGRVEDAAGWLEHELHLTAPHVDRVPRDYAETGLLLATVYDDLGRVDDARRIGRQMLRFSEARFGPDDGLTRSLRRFVDSRGP